MGLVRSDPARRCPGSLLASAGARMAVFTLLGMFTASMWIGAAMPVWHRPGSDRHVVRQLLPA